MGRRSRRRRSSDRKLFTQAMRDVQPLDRRGGPAVVRRPAGRPAPLAASAVEFEVRSYGEHLEGLAPGVDEGELRALQEGALPVELTVDLHGFSEEEARGMVHDTLRRAWKGELRCVVLIHGRGVRFPGDAVLKTALPEWLAEPPHGGRILAFSTAGEHGGSGGATAVLLRRRR